MSKSLSIFLSVLAVGCSTVGNAQNNGAPKPENLQLMQVQVGSNLALMAGNHILQGQKDLKANEMGKARDELIKANTILDVLNEQAGIPTAKARVQFADQRLDYETPQRVVGDLTPIYAELDIITDAKNNQEARKQLDKAKASLQKGDKLAAREALRKIDKLIIVREVAVPLKATQGHLDEAISAIDRKEADKAMQAVQAAQNSLHDDVVVTLDREGTRSAGRATQPSE